MRSLFLKIFLSYWMAQALFLVLAILVTLAMRPSREISDLQAQEPKFLNEGSASLSIWRRRSGAQIFQRPSAIASMSGFTSSTTMAGTVGTQPASMDRARETRPDRTLLTPFSVVSDRSSLEPDDSPPITAVNYMVIVDLPPEEHPLFGPHGSMASEF